MESSKGNLSPFTREHAKSERAHGRFKNFLRILTLAHVLAYPVRDEIAIAASNVPRAMDKALSGRDSEAQAKAMMDRFEKEVESGEPIPVDLLTFYLEQERESAGVSETDVRKARARFEEVMQSANALKSAGKSRAEVLGYVLKQQGKYSDESSLMTDLLLRGEGECEARQRFVSAAVQRLYPEVIRAGKMRTESFRSWVDAEGVLHPGHVRVVVNEEDDRVAVLEGDAVRYDSAEEHAKITSMETTRLAVTGYAAKEGLYDLNAGSVAEPDAGKKTLRDVVTDNSVSVYPTGATTYGTGETGTRDVDPSRVAGSWAHSHYDWDNAIELTVTKSRVPLTMENVEGVFNGQAGLFELDRYDVRDKEAMRKLVETREKMLESTSSESDYAFMIRGDQDLPAEAFSPGGRPISFLVRDGSRIPEALSVIPVSRLELFDVKAIPKNIWNVDYESNSTLRVVVSGGGDIDPNGALSGLRSSLYAGQISLDSSTSAKQRADRPMLNGIAFDGVKTKVLTVRDIFVPTFGSVVAEEIAYQGQTSVGQFSRVKARLLSISFPNDESVRDSALHSDDASGQGETARIEALRVSGDSYGAKAFARTDVAVLLDGVHRPLNTDTYEGASVGQLYFDTDPRTVFGRQITQLGSWNAATKPYLGEGIGVVVFVPANEDLFSYESVQKKGSGAQPSLLEQVLLARSTGSIAPSVRVVVLSGNQLSKLKARCGGIDVIPDSALFAEDYLKGAGNP